ncbi:MAG TPA: hypothetical protein VK638_37430 [Edaphobacter sp.]|nr:hypothetical protein [Edaphobacter sp.]
MMTIDADDTDARLAEDRRRLAICEEIEMLIAGVRPRYPDVQLAELASHMREPERTRLLVLLDESSEWIPFAMEIER